MTAETLRLAATELRALAAAATPGPWDMDARPGWATWTIEAPASDEHPDYTRSVADRLREADAEYVAKMHPPFALAVADWLDAAAEGWESMERQNSRHPDDDGQTRVLPNASDMAALAVARAYLNEEAAS